MKIKVESASNKKNDARLWAAKSFGGTFDFRISGGHSFANCGIGKNWLTAYLIGTEPQFQGEKEAQKLLQALKKWAKSTNRTFKVWCPNKIVRHICEKLDIKIA